MTAETLSLTFFGNETICKTDKRSVTGMQAALLSVFSFEVAKNTKRTDNILWYQKKGVTLQAKLLKPKY